MSFHSNNGCTNAPLCYVVQYTDRLSCCGVLTVTPDTYGIKCDGAGKTWMEVFVAYFEVGSTVPTVTSSMEFWKFWVRRNVIPEEGTVCRKN